MTDQRLMFFSSMDEDELSKIGMDVFTVSELKEIIDETPLTDTDRTIAEERLLRLMTFEQIADSVGISERTISRRMPYIQSKLRRTFGCMVGRCRCLETVML